MKTPLEIISNFFDYSNIFNIIIQFTVLFTILKYFQQRRSPYELNIQTTLFQFAFILGIIVIFWYFCLSETKKTSITPEQFQKANQQYHQNQKTLTQKQADLQQLDQKAATEQQKWEETKNKAKEKLAPIENEIRLTEIEKTRLEAEEIQKKIELQKQLNAKEMKKKELQKEERKLQEKEQEIKDQELALKQAKTDKDRQRIKEKLSKLKDEKLQIIVNISNIQGALERIDDEIGILNSGLKMIGIMKEQVERKIKELDTVAAPIRKHIEWSNERIEEIKNIRKNINKRINEIQIERKKYRSKQEEILMVYQKFQEYKANNPDDIVSCTQDSVKWCGRVLWKFAKWGGAGLASIVRGEDLASNEEAELMKEFANDKPKMITKEGFDNINQAMQNYINEITVEEQQLQQRLTDASFDRLKDEVILRETELEKKIRKSDRQHKKEIDEITVENAKTLGSFMNSLMKNETEIARSKEEINKQKELKAREGIEIEELNKINETIAYHENELQNTYPNYNELNNKILNKRGINITFTNHHNTPHTNTKK